MNDLPSIHDPPRNLVPTRRQPQSPIASYWKLLFAGLSIMLARPFQAVYGPSRLVPGNPQGNAVPSSRAGSRSGKFFYLVCRVLIIRGTQRVYTILGRDSDKRGVVSGQHCVPGRPRLGSDEGLSNGACKMEEKKDGGKSLVAILPYQMNPRHLGLHRLGAGVPYFKCHPFYLTSYCIAD